MKKYLILLLITSLFLVNIPVKVKGEQQANFTSITINDGLPQASISNIFQDDKGYIWFGTYGSISKYDGSKFKKFEANGKDSAIINSSITDIGQDKNGDIWVTTIDGISRIDYHTEEIKNYTESTGLENDCVSGMIAIKDKVIVSTREGLFIYNKYTDSFDKLYFNEEVDSNSITKIIVDDNDYVWISNTIGIFKLDIQNRKVVESYINELKAYKFCEDDKVSSMNYKDGYLWIGTVNSGLIKMNTHTKEIEKHYYKNSLENSLPDNTINNICIDERGDIWLATFDGIVKIQEDENKIVTYQNNKYDTNSLINNDVNFIMEDNTGLLWIATYIGVSILNPNINIETYRENIGVENSLSDGVIHGTYEDDDGLIWIGTKSQGINIIDRKTNQFSYINTSNSNISSNSISDIVGKGDIIAIGTENGINIYNKKTKEIKNYHNKKNSDNFYENFVRSLYIDDNDYLWISYLSGLYIIDLHDFSGHEVEEIFPEFKNNKLNNLRGCVVYQDSKGTYWIGTLDEGLYSLDTNSKKVSSYKNHPLNNSISSNCIECITEDEEGNIWIGTSLGLNKYNKEKNEFEVFTTEDGLTNNYIYGILQDNSNNLWISTNGGISKLDKKTGKFYNLDYKDGLQSNEFNSNAYYKLKSGELLFGGISGVSIFNPDEVKFRESIPNLVIDSFIVNGEKRELSSNYKLKYYENTININLFSPDYSTKDRKYYYKLEDENEWYISDSNSIMLNKLASGNYTFAVKTKSKDGTFSDETTINIQILPPIWKSNVAIFMYILVVVMILYLIRNKVQMLDEIISRRTKELNKEMDKNNKLLMRVIELERSKNNYLVNMSHELRTPLNVLSSIQQLMMDLNKKSTPIEKDDIEYYMEMSKRNTNRLLTLITDIVDTSKIENGSYKLSIKENDIVYVVEEAALSLKDYIESKGVNLIIDPQIEECLVECDSVEIERCIINLISNAVKFTEAGGNITVKIYELEKGVKIIISDTGSGIDEKYLDIIFDRFSQISESKEKMKLGSGLGLTITKHIINLHKGDISVKSQINKGSEFMIFLPKNQ